MPLGRADTATTGEDNPVAPCARAKSPAPPNAQTEPLASANQYRAGTGPEGGGAARPAARAAPPARTATGATSKNEASRRRTVLARARSERDMNMQRSPSARPDRALKISSHLARSGPFCGYARAREAPPTGLVGDRARSARAAPPSPHRCGPARRCPPRWRRRIGPRGWWPARPCAAPPQKRWPR